LQSLLNRVTVQETAFFRHPEHFEVLARDILPTLPQPVTIWSAGCANGQEAYSLAMLLEEQGIAGTVIASDLSTAALQRTADARYTARELTGLSAERIAAHGTLTSHHWQIHDRLRARVRIVRHNLIEPLPEVARSCQVVFCRNVLIYFSAEHARPMLDRLADALPAALVFLGSAETMWSISDRYQTVRVGDTFYYRRSSVRSASLPAVAPPALDVAGRATVGPLPVPSRPVPVSSGPVAAPSGPVAAPSGPLPVPSGSPSVSSKSVHEDDSAAATDLKRAGQQALNNGDHAAAVVAFRKCAYLTPDDAVAHLYLGLALEASGDLVSAQRAFRAARQATLSMASGHIEHAIGGYAPAELLRLLDSKRQVLA
jgi:chemotaxis protein methyltransferase CheR